MDLHHQGYRGELSGILTEHLSGLSFPANKEMILRQARQGGLDMQILAELEGLPAREFKDLREVLDHFAGGTMSIDSPLAGGEAVPDRGDEDMTGLRQGKPTPSGAGSRNVRDNLGDPH